MAVRGARWAGLLTAVADAVDYRVDEIGASINACAATYGRQYQIEISRSGFLIINKCALDERHASFRSTSPAHRPTGGPPQMICDARGIYSVHPRRMHIAANDTYAHTGRQHYRSSS